LYDIILHHDDAQCQTGAENNLINTTKLIKNNLQWLLEW